MEPIALIDKCEAMLAAWLNNLEDRGMPAVECGRPATHSVREYQRYLLCEEHAKILHRILAEYHKD